MFKEILSWPRMKEFSMRDLWTMVDQHEDLSYRDGVETPTHDRDWEDDGFNMTTACLINGEYGGFSDPMTEFYRYGTGLPTMMDFGGQTKQCTPDSEFGEYIIYSMSLLSEKYAGVCPTYCSSDY